MRLGHQIVVLSRRPGRVRDILRIDRPLAERGAADPDLVIRERMAEGRFRNVVAIEIKGGTDYSNVHNRIGEAEKSHRKARAAGYTECWTVINVPGLDPTLARKESPTTDRIYTLDGLADAASEEYQDFRNRMAALTGIRLKTPRR